MEFVTYMSQEEIVVARVSDQKWDFNSSCSYYKVLDEAQIHLVTDTSGCTVTLKLCYQYL